MKLLLYTGEPGNYTSDGIAKRIGYISGNEIARPLGRTFYGTFIC